jgi:hypothetical protein
MGVVQALPQKDGVATLWVLSSGAIVACDATFTGGELAGIHRACSFQCQHSKERHVVISLPCPPATSQCPLPHFQPSCADWLGYKQGDLQLNSFSDLVIEKEEVDR